MADANISLKTKNVFGLPASFGLQNATRNVSRSMPTAFGNTGACAASESLEGRIDYSQAARYCGTTLRTDLGALATAFGQVSTAGTELITNGDLSTGDTTGWILFDLVGGATMTVVDGALKTTPATAGAQFDIRPQTAGANLFSLVIGTSYTLQFDAWADSAKTCRAFLYSTDGTPTPVSDAISLTATRQTFSYTFTATETDDDYQFLLAGGDTTTPWYLDNVSLQQSRSAEYSVVPTDLSLSYSASDNTTLTLNGHNHETLPHTSMSVTADISKIIPQTGFGVPAFGITLGDNCSPFSAELSAQIEHFDVNDADGTHIHGENTEKVSCGLSMTFSGIPTTTDEATLETELKAYFTGQGITISHLTVTSTDENNANSQFDGFALAAEFYAVSD